MLQVDNAKINVLKNWTPASNIEIILIGIKNEMIAPVNKKLA